jgi:hypothetical protein
VKVLVACEFSGIVRDAFIAAGHDAMSCDLLDTERPGPHYKGDVRDVLNDGWSLMVAHPPCTDLAVSGARHFAKKGRERRDAAISFVRLLLTAPIERIAVENPVSVISTEIGPPTQIIQPWQFGHGETKATCLWLKNLPKLQPTDVVDGREPHIWKPRKNGRWLQWNDPETAKQRSVTYSGIAAAMATQWGRDDLPVQLELSA